MIYEKQIEINSIAQAKITVENSANLKQGAHINETTAWPVPHAAIDNCFALIGAYE